MGNIELKEFITQTLVQIKMGIDDAIEGGVMVTNKASIGKMHYHIFKNVDFDISVTASEIDSAKGKIGVFLGPIGAGVEGGEEIANTSYNRIKFTVPIDIGRKANK